MQIDPTIEYDVIELPSRGIYYESKKKSVKVSYLTAADENILMAPNFVKTNQIVDEILRRKILDRDFKVEEMVEDDKQAVMMWLRNTSFGTEYKTTLKDPKTDKPFEVTVDLSSLKYKEFTLEPDEKGEYTYVMPISKKTVTFMFLNKKQEDELEKIKNDYSGVGPIPTITKTLEMMIKSVDGERDIMKIYQYVNAMPIKDSQEFRKFVADNKPGLDLIRETMAPSGEKVQYSIGFGVEFFRPFYGL